MHGFVSKYTNKLDAKGRVSIPAPFRTVLARDGFEGLYCFPSPHDAAIDAGGNALLNQISAKLDGLDPLSEEYDMVSTALYGDSEVLKVDSEGRINLTDMIREATGITNTVTFVGMRFKFRIWEPGRFDAYRAEASQRTFTALGGSGRRSAVE